MELLNPLSTYRALNLFFRKDAHRVGIELQTTGSPRVFDVGEFFQHDPAAVTIDVFHNGRKLIYTSTQSPEDGEFTVAESTPSAGYDQVVLTRFSSNSHSTLSANYFAK